ncbi:MAG: VOC family protein [Alphaproteobacteria bacterium]|nr:VOC family protein [Alphaproteobacteria bacterium]
MTAIHGYIAPTRRADVLGVHSLDHFGLQVPDVAQAQRFYTTFGLDVAEAGDGIALGVAGGGHRWVQIRPGAAKRLRYLSFGAFADDVARFRARLDAQGIARIEPPAGVESNGLWFHDCDGTPVEIKVAEKTSPNAKSPTDNISAGPNARGAPTRGATAQVRPRRMAHALIFCRDIGTSVRFYRDVLGLRLSDEAGAVAFMHGVHGSDHHLLAFAKSDAPGLHHCSWDVGSIHEVGLGAMQMADSGFAAGWGLGRHVLGSNYFHYVRDPWGSFAEYSSDIDYIPVDADWDAQAHPPENSFYLWGPTPPADFAVNYEASPNLPA